MERARQVLYGAIAVLAGALLLWLWLPSLASAAREFDMLGMLRQMDQTNGEIGRVNTGILTALGNVRQQVEGVDRVGARLGTMEGLLGEQNAELEKLRVTIAEQVALSRELRELTAGVEPATAGLARTAAAEAGALEAMRDATARMARQLRQIGAVNESTAGKLDQAEELSAIVLSRMP